MNTKEFIEKAKLIHGSKYDYSKSLYTNVKEKICIICKKHGEFYQRYSDHLNGHGCAKCGFIVGSNKQSLTTEKFIGKTKEIHNDKYNYSKVKYINNHNKVCIICPEHGEFWQTPNDHLTGYGCPACSGVKKLTTEEFIKKAKIIHGEKYNYSKVVYEKTETKVCIICPVHGEFWQTPHDHLNNVGCPICNESKLERETAQLLSEHNIEYERQKRFKWLGRQSLDFYLPDYGIGIECQGRQHFEPVNYFGGEDGFLKTIERDERKYKICKHNNIEILYYTNEKLLTKNVVEHEVFTNLNKILKELKYDKEDK